MHHILLGIADGWRERAALRRLLAETPPAAGVLSIAPEFLERRGVTALALDFDGVLAPHGADRPLPEVEQWLRRMAASLGENRVLILSNRPEGARVDWFRDNMPGVRFVAGVRKKPYPDGLKKAGELASVPLPRMMMVDDRLLTGCLAALNAGCIPFYVRTPYVKVSSNPRQELFFMALRWAERLFVRVLP